MAEDVEDEDPFAGLDLDNTFVDGASMREPSARARANRLAFERSAQLDAERRAREDRPGRRVRRRLAAHRYRNLAIVATVLLLVGIVVVDRTGHGPDSPGAWGSDGALTLGAATSAGRPPLRESASRHPLGSPPAAPARLARAPFRFLSTQSTNGKPVAYDPCRRIHVVINEATAPSGATTPTTEALRSVSHATGLQFVVEGSTRERPDVKRPGYVPARYGDRWAPVLLAWTDPETVPVLKGDVAGVGGSRSFVGVPGSPAAFVSGFVYLDGPQIAQILQGPDGRRVARAVILHELGHLVGLDHVDDPTQLMNPFSQDGVVRYQDGDREGLRRLGSGPCIRRL